LWINRTLHLDVPVIEDLGTGAVYCQLLDAAFGQRVPMHKVNWKAKFEYEFINNLKVFQEAMEKIGIAKKIDVIFFVIFRYKN
jgi:RP/EB family microtubule-associated protein